MSCSPLEMLEMAKAIYTKDCGEAACRAAASRAYYAAYHAAISHHRSLPSPGSNIDGSGSHQQLISCLRNPTVKDPKARMTSKEIGDSLMGAFALRIKADYKPQLDFLHQEALDALEKAADVFQQAINELAL